MFNNYEDFKGAFKRDIINLTSNFFLVFLVFRAPLMILYRLTRV